MQAIQAFGYEQIFTELLRGLIDTVADKPGLSPERKSAAQQTVICSVMAFNPRDPVEAMLAGQCVIYDHMVRDSAKDTLCAPAEQLRLRARPGVLAAGKMFLGTLGMLVKMNRRPEAQLAFARPEPAQEEAPKQPTAAPVAAAEAPEAADHDAPSYNPAPVQPPSPAASALPATNRATPVQAPAAPAVTAREETASRQAERLMIDIRDPAVRSEIAAAATLLANGGA